MRGRYRFLQTKAGKTYFGRVGLEVQPGSETMEIVDALPDKVNTEEGEANRHTDPSWVVAALDGIRATMAYAQQMGLQVAGHRVVLDELIGSLVDTRDDVIRCAAGLALWEALNTPRPAPKAEFDGQRWNLVFPARSPTAVQEITQ
jgi:hypothetical protein